MTSTTTTITTEFSRELTIVNRGYEFNLGVKDTDGKYARAGEVYTHLTNEHAAELATALLGENATVITDLPKVTRDYGFVTANGYDHGENADPAELVRHAKALLAIAANITEHKAKKAAELEAATIAAKEAEIKRDKRRDELAAKFGTYSNTYSGFSTLAQSLVDQIIELEEAAQVS